MPQNTLCTLSAHTDYIAAEINDIDFTIKNLISSNPDYENTVQLLCTILDVKRDSDNHYHLRNWYWYVSIL